MPKENQINKTDLSWNYPCQVNYLFELCWNYHNYSIQKWFNRTRFQTFRKRFCKLQETKWPTVIDKICRVRTEYKIFTISRPLLLNKLFVWINFSLPEIPHSEMIHLSRFQFLREYPKCKLQDDAIWLTVINEIFKFPSHLDHFFQIKYLFELSWGCPDYPIQTWYICARFQTSI